MHERKCELCAANFFCVSASDRELCDYHLDHSDGYVPKGLYENGAPLPPPYIRRPRRDYQKWLARKRVEKAVFYGKLIKPTACSWCKEEGGVIHGHHDDYEKPLEVEWLCQPCHQELHNFYNQERRVL